MTTHVRYNATTLVAGADLTGADKPYKAIAIGGTIAATNQAAVGILMNKASSGEHITVAYEGEVKVYAGAAVSAAGNRLAVTTSGFLITATDSRATVGRALESASSGDLFRALVNFVNAN